MPLMNIIVDAYWFIQPGLSTHGVGLAANVAAQQSVRLLPPFAPSSTMCRQSTDSAQTRLSMGVRFVLGQGQVDGSRNCRCSHNADGAHAGRDLPLRVPGGHKIKGVENQKTGHCQIHRRGVRRAQACSAGASVVQFTRTPSSYECGRKASRARPSHVSTISPLSSTSLSAQ